MRALWLHQPYPTLIEIGVKQWETRGGPPNGPMCPAGVRGMPGLAIQPGERIAIVAAVRPPMVGQVGDFAIYAPTAPGGGYAAWTSRKLRRDRKLAAFFALPLGVVVCTAVVAEALPILPEADEYSDGRACIESYDGRLRLWGEDADEFTALSDQLPYGDWTPGRWAWRLTDVESVPAWPKPVVVRGNRQGVCEIDVLAEGGES